GAGLLAGGLDVAVDEIALLLEGGVLGQLDALHAEAALLHHAARPHRHVRVQHHAPERARHVEIEGVVLGVVVPVEAADLVRAVVEAVAGPDAAVVDLLVDPLGAGGRRQHRADGLAGGVLAVLAHHGHVHAARVLDRPAVVVIDAQPGHRARAPDLI